MVSWASGTPPKVRAVWLGLCCWAVSALLPSLHRASHLAPASWALLALAPALLGLGVALFRAHPALASYVLLCGFPVALTLSMSRFEHELGLTTYSPGSLFFSLLTLGGYAASVSQLGAAHEPERPVEHKPLGEVPPVDAEGRKQQVGLLALVVGTLGGVGSVFWGSWQGPGLYREHWGRAAPTGAVLTALVAGILGACAVAFIAPGLRAERKRHRREQTRAKKVTRALLTALSFGMLYVLAKYR